MKRIEEQEVADAKLRAKAMEEEMKQLAKKPAIIVGAPVDGAVNGLVGVKGGRGSPDDARGAGKKGNLNSSVLREMVRNSCSDINSSCMYDTNYVFLYSGCDFNVN
jgi:hypothetical protein